MISYRDMTFCPFYKDCKSAHMCSRPLTAKVRDDAEKFGLPLSMYTSKPECWSLKVTECAPSDAQEGLMCH